MSLTFALIFLAVEFFCVVMMYRAIAFGYSTVLAWALACILSYVGLVAVLA